MRIGELAKLTDTPARSLRYYEEQELIIPRRLPNGYREYDEYLINRVNQIRGLINSGLPTKIIKQILPCVDKTPTIHPGDATPELLAVLEEQRDRMNQRIDCLTRNRDAINSYIDVVSTTITTSTGASAA
ncbi:MerR family transcriptional regulator [Arthrobacter sp. ok362]|uniref:MerR family transcriptional regulator n=1 Tax=Arthrobacter sp. ok362 TaxID=1761745 RepID=UPI0008921323|nr:MerR family transcriptional regulator [Arthrobacter sp. ok362]SDL90455.1 DNA-binding transcriptional regulator, MerR family [Arthrobacter sp. ok362]